MPAVRFNDETETIKTPKPEGDSIDDPYFEYYSSLQNQANMLSDTLRTSGYRNAILGNAVPSFQGKTVMDVGAGSGVLSFFAAEAGAELVYAMEASNMAKQLQAIVEQSNRGGANPQLKGKIHVVKGKIEDYSGPKVDTLISEPIGVLLVHERMIESYIHARDTFLKPGGSMFPSGGLIHLAPFTDEGLYLETLGKAAFFQQNLYGIDLSFLAKAAMDEVFAQPVVGLFPPTQLVCNASSQHMLDFYTISQKELKEFEIPISWVVERTSLVHGIATWFDIHFDAPTANEPHDNTAGLEWEQSIWNSQTNTMGQPGLGTAFHPPPPPKGFSSTLPTGPHSGKTHWQQCRLLFSEPLAANAGETVEGFLKFKVNEHRSYDLESEMWLSRNGGGRGVLETSRKGSFSLHLQTFNYSYTG
ncbi:S-adenosyl-L-methionine-dependent methyltransferase [Mrakia frigida]|uniref:S-adenosyl-L-methionine-dependent methyltransferase n=1 Tax=Mrakia frigida TaxID=29902 RepID=UPI003FCC145B